MVGFDIPTGVLHGKLRRCRPRLAVRTSEPPIASSITR
jgi:hypothetical protein